MRLESGFELRDDLSISPPGGPEHMRGALREGHDSYVDRPEVDGVERDWTEDERAQITIAMVRRWFYWGLVGSLDGFADDAVQQCDWCQGDDRRQSRSRTRSHVALREAAMNDVLHLAAGGLFALGWLGLGVHAYGRDRLYARPAGTEGRALAFAAYGPVVTALAWCVAGAMEIAARVLGP